MGYAATMVGLNHLWYSKDTRTGFHFFNDNNEWKQIDKVGHFYTAFHLSRTAASALQWCGTKEKKVALWSASVGFMMILSVEVFDGFSAAYGASTGDLIANTSGILFYTGQHLAWDEVRIMPKLSAHYTRYAALRPNTLGSNLPERILKDYNGQTYWLSANIYSFFKQSRIPKWLNVSVGYGAEGMLFGHDNLYPVEYEYLIPYHKPYRQYYLTLDVDFSRIKTKHKGLKQLFYVLNMVHVPFPALELSSNGAKFHYFYF